MTKRGNIEFIIVILASAVLAYWLLYLAAGAI